MTTLELYLEFVTKVNKLGTYENRYFSPDKFVLLWNDQQDRWLEHSLGKKEDSNELQDLQFLYVEDDPVSKIDSKDRYNRYTIPDYYSIAKVYAKGKKDTCISDLLVRPLKHPANLEEIWNDWCNEPNWEYRETLYNVSDDKLLVYKKGFDIDTVFISYWRSLKPIDIEGYEKLDGTISTTINPELISSIYLRQILDLVIAEFYRITPTQTGLEYAKDRITTSERENF